ncbi:MAG: hypothetical protein OQK09_12100 [Colwellia sp.]|nr:hypothetical protein [Colwellia sp.]MCW8864519.1 hypothetical protein [Colwellia sp.]MCW9082245.1 hypothetical protein [Colwellia sp.]
MSNLDQWKNKTVEELINRPKVELSPQEMERRQIYSSLLFAITAYYFNGNKYGDNNNYPLNPKNLKSDSYLGHNIAALAVNKHGEVIDFEFNHNRLFSSSVEHAESRLIRRVFSLTQVHNSWKDDAQDLPKKYGNLLSEVSVYTTLESCTQCTGIMTLGDVKNVIYLQDDAGMYHIGNIVKNLTDGQGFIEAPLPISGIEIEFDLYDELNDAFIQFKTQQRSKEGLPFVVFPNGEEKYTSSITSFLCTKEAYNIFKKGLDKLEGFELNYADFQPNEKAMSNKEVLEECVSFYAYATSMGKRGTPHRM